LACKLRSKFEEIYLSMPQISKMFENSKYTRSRRHVVQMMLTLTYFEVHTHWATDLRWFDLTRFQAMTGTCMYRIILFLFLWKIDLKSKLYNTPVGYIFVVSEHFNSLTRDSVTLNNTLSISHSLRPLAAGPIRNAENMETLLVIGNYLLATIFRNA